MKQTDSRNWTGTGQAWLLQGMLTMALVVGGCAGVPEEPAPDQDTLHNYTWSGEISEHFTKRSPGEMTGRANWHLFNDPVLEQLIGDLLRSNLTLAGSRERVRESLAQRGVIAAAGNPQVNLEAEVYTARTGEKGLAFQGPPPGKEMEIYSLGGLTTWEIDFWGRTASLIEAADRESQAYQEAFRHAAVSMVAELCLAYIDARALEQRIELLDENVRSLEESLNIAQSQLEAGNGTRLEVIRINQLLEGMLAQKPAFKQAHALACNRIALLTGVPPGEFTLEPGEMPKTPKTGSIGIPADLLTRRADVRQAERIYAAAVARAAATKAERYPRLSLTGNMKLQTSKAGHLFSPDALIYSLGPNLTYPLFNGGRIASQIAVSQSQSEQARLRLQQALLEAVTDVENAGISVVQSANRKLHVRESVEQSRNAMVLAEQLHESGLGNLLQVLDAKRELVNRKDAYTGALQAELKAFVRLYRALGGGWDTLPLPPSNPVNEQENMDK